jgi:hypothetical protein
MTQLEQMYLIDMIDRTEQAYKFIGPESAAESPITPAAFAPAGAGAGR